MGWLGGGWSPGDRIVSTASRRHGAVRAAPGSLGKHRRRLWLTMVSAGGGFRAGASRTGSKLESPGRTPRAELARRPHAAELCAHRLARVASRLHSPSLHGLLSASYRLTPVSALASPALSVRAPRSSQSPAVKLIPAHRSHSATCCYATLFSLASAPLSSSRLDRSSFCSELR